MAPSRPAEVLVLPPAPFLSEWFSLACPGESRAFIDPGPGESRAGHALPCLSGRNGALIPQTRLHFSQTRPSAEWTHECEPPVSFRPRSQKRYAPFDLPGPIQLRARTGGPRGAPARCPGRESSPAIRPSWTGEGRRGPLAISLSRGPRPSHPHRERGAP
jgi:hypothetical protein